MQAVGEEAARREASIEFHGKQHVAHLSVVVRAHRAERITRRR